MENQEELFIPKRKHVALKIIIAVILIAGLVVGGYFLYQNKFNNPNKIVSDILEKERKNIDDSFNKAVNTSDKYEINGLVKANVELSNELKDIANLINDINLQFNGQIDPTNNVYNINLDTKYKNDKLLDIKAHYENETIYVLLDKLFDKYLKISTKDLTSMANSESISQPEITKDDIKTITNSLFDAIKKELDNHELKKELAKIIIDGSEKEVNNNYFELKDNEIKDFITNIVNNLANDNKFIATLEKITGEKNIKDELGEIKNSLKFEKQTYKVNFYTTKSLFNQELVSIRQELLYDNQKTAFIVDKISNDEVLISVDMNGAVSSVRIKKNGSSVNLDLSINFLGMVVKLETNLNYEKINELTKVDVSNNKDISELTEEDQNKIQENLSKNEAFIKLMETISKLEIANEE